MDIFETAEYMTNEQKIQTLYDHLMADVVKPFTDDIGTIYNHVYYPYNSGFLVSDINKLPIDALDTYIDYSAKNDSLIRAFEIFIETAKIIYGADDAYMAQTDDLILISVTIGDQELKESFIVEMD